MPSPVVALALDERWWIPTESASARFTAQGREMWLETVERHLAAAMGVTEVPSAVMESLARLEPSAAGIDRYLFVPQEPGPLSVVTVRCLALSEGWRSEFEEAVNHPVGLLRDTEITPLDLPWTSDGIAAIRSEDSATGPVFQLVCVAPRDRFLVVVRGTTKSASIVASMRVAIERALAGSELVPAAPSI